MYFGGSPKFLTSRTPEIFLTTYHVSHSLTQARTSYSDIPRTVQPTVKGNMGVHCPHYHVPVHWVPQVMPRTKFWRHALLLSARLHISRSSHSEDYRSHALVFPLTVDHTVHNIVISTKTDSVHKWWEVDPEILRSSGEKGLGVTSREFKLGENKESR